eukprot:TRINITY_DN17703_c0_g1_i6.p1 TRINITY_DN17703_c0_g1~~TRINITY_DN17703_c0_g1_i6.p1  ORF type:complete len:211 (+),score=60.69 TRINITY_DN17703_c0_g1_i6:84-635(+)
MLRSLVGSEMCIRDRYQRRVRGKARTKMACAVVHFSSADQEVLGQLQITQETPDSEIVIKGELNGLKPGLHGLQVHDFGDFTDGASSAGGIFNPDCKNHGGPGEQERMAGDLGNIEADADGKARVEISDPVATLFGDRSILARSLIVHENEDDYGKAEDDPQTAINGNVGDGVAWGVIGLSGC